MSDIRQLGKIEHMLEARDKRITNLEAALVRHGEHDHDCPAAGFGPFKSAGKCNCGLDAALEQGDE